MDKVYDFNWMVREIDNSIIFMLYKDNELVGGYQASYILAGDMNGLLVKFANVDDLDKFLNYAVIRFCDVKNPYNIVDIPVRSLKKMYEVSNKLEENKDRKRIRITDLECFAILNKKVINDDYFLEIVNFGDISDELKQIIAIADRYNKMGMQEKFDGLANINLTNYQVEKSKLLK